MHTAYYTTGRFVRHTGNVVDFQAYRAMRSLEQEGSLAPKPRPCCTDPALAQAHPYLQLCPPFVQTSSAPTNMGRRRRQRRALTIELLASMGVVVMTLSFTLRILLG